MKQLIKIFDVATGTRRQKATVYALALWIAAALFGLTINTDTASLWAIALAALNFLAAVAVTAAIASRNKNLLSNIEE